MRFGGYTKTISSPAGSPPRPQPRLLFGFSPRSIFRHFSSRVNHTRHRVRQLLEVLPESPYTTVSSPPPAEPDTGHWTLDIHPPSSIHPPSILHPSILEMSQRDNLVLLIHLRFIGLPGRHPAGPADRQTDRDTGQGHSETRTQREEAGESSRSHRVRAVTELASGECVCLVAADRCVIVSASNRGFLKPTGKSILPRMVG